MMDPSDRLALTPPGSVQLRGWLGARYAANEQNRLLAIDLQSLLAGYRHRPGNHPWIGEHIGKWLHAATLTWACTGNPALREKLDRAVRDLLATQEPDGYLGTYTPDRRFGLFPGADWDVWCHKYNLIGLLTYHRYTGAPEALTACRRIGDLLVATFGPGKKSILSAGTHVGMAATSVLEPIALLYRCTGEPRYLEFARYLVDAWEEPGGPRLLTSLSQGCGVHRTANAKAYEMLSNLVGLCELARATGEARYSIPARRAWDDIATHHLYLTGTASQHERFHEPGFLPNDPDSHIGETCVTVTWIQLCSQLLRLTGEARYGDELERSLYNHLTAAQRPDGAEWCYYTPLEGTKPYGPGINCCVSSGPRGLALAPLHVYLRGREGGADWLAVNLFEASRAVLSLGGRAVTVEQETTFPREGETALAFRIDGPARFGVMLRVPAWARRAAVEAPGFAGPARPDADGWWRLPPREWRDGERIRVRIPLIARLARGWGSNTGRAALVRGPLVLALDEAENPRLGSPSEMAFAARPAPRSISRRGRPGVRVRARVQAPGGGETTADFIPFAEAGSAGSAYCVWLEAPARG